MGSKTHRAAIAEALIGLQGDAGPERALELVRDLRAAAELLESELISEARDHGLSWARIGAVYGLTKQGAQQRFRGQKTPSASH